MKDWHLQDSSIRVIPRFNFSMIGSREGIVKCYVIPVRTVWSGKKSYESLIPFSQSIANDKLIIINI